MYETVIWVSFIAMATAVLLEAIYRRRHFFYAGVPASVVTLIIADTQPLILDSSINPLTAVLRNNYWLVIHVLTIVSAYGTFLLAAALGHMALIMKMSGWARRRDLEEAYLYIYRSMQIGVLLLATGTILGGIWANYSWGRFWGWDPKEVWALVTLLCYLIVLHGRLANYWSGLGLAFGSVICWFSVLMSWYGVNYVLPAGKSLHGYGAGTGGFSSVLIYSLGELLFVAVSGYIIAMQTRHLKTKPSQQETPLVATRTRTV
jgi:ABC-type transport system involved in cytochrome c biogenesis permease subunit